MKWGVFFFTIWGVGLLGGVCAREPRPWHAVRHWGYQLQKLDVKVLSSSPFDLLVIDYSRDGSEAGRFSREEITALKGTGAKRRLVLAYLSIGEAERYRYYWKPAWDRNRPGWLAQENPRWKGNYKVRYWDPEWKRIIFGGADSYLDKIMAAGFDGVYLDIIDAYEHFEEQGRSSAREEMKRFVREIATYARGTKGDADFGIFPQNGEELLDDPEYRALITGIGKEDTYYGYEEDDHPSPPEATARIERFLDLARKAGKLVLNVDYCREPTQVADAYRKAAARGYVEYCAVRALDRLVPQPWMTERAP